MKATGWMAFAAFTALCAAPVSASIQRKSHRPPRNIAAAILLPSGDQLRTHVWPRSFVSWRIVPPARSITAACVELPSLSSTASRRSSRDHAG